MLTQWNAGLYEQQDDNQEEHNLRGKFVTDSNGEYSLYCLRPTPYPVSNPQEIRQHAVFRTDKVRVDPQRRSQRQAPRSHGSSRVATSSHPPHCKSQAHSQPQEKESFRDVS